MTTRTGILLLIVMVLPVAAFHPQTGSAKPDDFQATTVFLIRHAEKADAPKQDPPLSEAGKVRASELARMLGGAGIKAIYSSPYKRATETAGPLATLLGIQTTVLPIEMSTANPQMVSPQSIQAIIDRIHSRSGEAALVIGHSNTIPEVIKMLVGDVVPTIDEQKFDDLFVVTVYEKGKAKVAQLKYGAK
jgi:phosphohistidine phosphatase SixA